MISAQMEGFSGIPSPGRERDSLISLRLIGRTLCSVSSKDKNKQRSQVCEQLHKQCNLEVCKKYVGYIYIRAYILLIRVLLPCDHRMI